MDRIVGVRTGHVAMPDTSRRSASITVARHVELGGTREGDRLASARRDAKRNSTVMTAILNLIDRETMSSAKKWPPRSWPTVNFGAPASPSSRRPLNSHCRNDNSHPLPQRPTTLSPVPPAPALAVVGTRSPPPVVTSATPIRRARRPATFESMAARQHHRCGRLSAGPVSLREGV